MAETFKDRDEHRGKPAPHLGQDHYEKSRTEAAAGGDTGPAPESGGKAADHREQPEQPADVTYRAQRAIEKGSESDPDKRPKALEEAVEDLDDGLSVKPDRSS
jgi:hypothetical protein